MAPTFASAAAGNNASSSRPDAPGEWPRRANGATQTFRRPSHATSLSGSTAAGTPRDGSGSVSSNPGVYVPPHAQSGRNGSAAEGRYSRDQLHSLFRAQRDADELKDGLSNLYVGSWEPNISNGSSSATWGRRDDPASGGQNGVDLCWDKDGSVMPLSLSDLTEEERDAFTSSVNSPLKPPTQNPNKDGTPKEALSLRKISVSQGGSAAYGLASPTSARPSNRRRETSEAYPFPSNLLASPSTSRFPRDEPSAVTPPPALVRRRTDFKEPAPGAGPEERDKEKGGAGLANPFGSLKRTTTAPFGAAAAGGSPWTASSPATAFSPMGSFGSFVNPQNEKKPGFGSVRGESKFKGLMSKTSTEELDKGVREKASLSNLGKVSEGEPSRQSTTPWMEARSNRPTSNDTDPFPEDDFPSGSAALRGGQDVSPPRLPGFGSFTTPHRQESRDPAGFSAFGMTTDNTGPRDMFHGRENFPHQTPQHRDEPMSPTDTNPYQSPEHNRNPDDDGDSDGSDIQHAHYPGMGSFHADPSLGPASHGFGGLAGLGAGDRSQTSSVGPTRGFPTLPGLGTGLGALPGLGGAGPWPQSQQTIGTPVRERALGGGFDGMFGTMGEAQSPSLAGLGGGSLFGAGGGLGGTSTMGRASRLGSLFPTAMQDQMRNEQPRASIDEGSQGDRHQSMTGTFGRNAFSQAPGAGIPARDTDSPFRNTRGLFDDFSGGHEGDNRSVRSTDPGLSDPVSAAFAHLQSSAQISSSTLATASQPGANPNRPAPTGQPPTVSSPVSGQPPAPQQRTMVMPDRMRWIYRDPQGVIQGPFSGLEMHDWYKGGYFSPELLVKKFEDPDYEPLAQLIRRIGNSREPFLVPQIGIPHGQPTSQPGPAWSAGPAVGAQPPFANSFPSFGTTLTAEQQNALERRKQEEQYLMARQKEYLAAQQQVIGKGVGPNGILPQQLHHHSSAHSLHSQPSFGSITSPGGYQPSPTQAPLPGGPSVPGLYDNNFRPNPVSGLGPIGPGLDMLGNLREEDVPAMMDRLNIGRTGQPPFGSSPMPFGQQQPESNTHAQQVVAMLSDRARLQREQAEHDAVQRAAHNDQQAAQATADRLQQFHDLRLQTDLDQSSSAIRAPEGVIGKPQTSAAATQEYQTHSESAEAQYEQTAPVVQEELSKSEPLSLTEQVQKAQSKQSPVPQSPWAKVEPAIHPFPPPPSQSPLPAPAAQRKPIVADSLATESRSRSETPSADTPSASIAPWAKEPAEASRGPSLKEIQEAEARKAAEREAIAQAARREAFERELVAQTHSPAAQPGLPSTSNWASGASPMTPVGGQSAWSKPIVGKPQGQPTAPSKKTFQQIQKEEAARQQRATAAAAAANAATALGAAAANLSSGKRYADLASKQTATQLAGPGVGGAWMTVGPSGKPKGLVPAVPAGPAVMRSASGGTVPTAVAKKPAAMRSATLGGTLGKQNAEDEFRRWAVGELKSDLGKGINADEFVSSLLTFPQDIELLTESVHSASSTLDSRHFAEEFLRRRKLADKGIVDSTATMPPADGKSGNGGWSEVAKKGTPAQTPSGGPPGLEAAGSFKVVAPKKKGKR